MERVSQRPPPLPASAPALALPQRAQVQAQALALALALALAAQTPALAMALALSILGESERVAGLQQQPRLASESVSEPVSEQLRAARSPPGQSSHGWGLPLAVRGLRPGLVPGRAAANCCAGLRGRECASCSPGGPAAGLRGRVAGPPRPARCAAGHRARRADHRGRYRQRAGRTPGFRLRPAAPPSAAACSADRPPSRPPGLRRARTAQSPRPPPLCPGSPG